MSRKVHAVVARSTFRSQNVKKHQGFGPLLEVQMSRKVHAVAARSTFRSQNVKKHQGFGPLLEVQMSLRVAGARDCAPCQT